MKLCKAFQTCKLKQVHTEVYKKKISGVGLESQGRHIAPQLLRVAAPRAGEKWREKSGPLDPVDGNRHLRQQEQAMRNARLVVV